MRMTLSSFNRRGSKRPTKSLEPGDRDAHVLAIAARKGGVGKTTTAVSLASAWARLFGLKTLLVDLDPQSSCSLALRGVIPEEGGALSTLLAESTGLEVAEVAVETRIPGLSMTTRDLGLVTVESRMSARIGHEQALRRALEITRSHFDRIVLDCPPNMGPLTLNALVAADSVLVPCPPAALSIPGVVGLLDAVEDVRQAYNPDLELAGVVLTRVDGRTHKTNAQAMELFRESFGDLVLPVQIGVSNDLAGAQLEGVDVFGHAPTGRGALQYAELAEALL
jgi:chromosome partitioning protein